MTRDAEIQHNADVKVARRTRERLAAARAKVMEIITVYEQFNKAVTNTAEMDTSWRLETGDL